MKDFIEKTKDILYNLSDYIIIFGIIIGIAFIIGWRLDILFPKTVTTIERSETIQSENNESKLVKKSLPEVKDEKETEVPVGSEPPVEAEPPIEVEEPVTIKVLIPDNPTITDVGNVLLNLELINSMQEFEDKVAELSYEKSFHAGEFDVQKPSSLEEVLNSIAE